MSEETLDIPLFPLQVVLFPGMALPLHIFEERYRWMIADCLEGKRQIGVILAKPEAEGTVTAYSIGTSALIAHVDEQEDGTMDILTAGLDRFRVLHLLRTEPYIVGRIEWFPLEKKEAPGAVRLANKAKTPFARYLRLVSEVLGTTIHIESAPKDPTDLAYLMAIALQVSMEEKQELLSIPSLPALLWRECLILSREEMLLSRMQRAQRSNTGYVRGITSDLSIN
ncbi:MAG: LON peptidase substrate-binding domain-containing protein [Chloroflexi bacterium]|nr:LON peptidase substrate-binding domain-containing protein [Chloroflexota bacterium]